MGNRFSFIHCADLHLGARFVGITDDDPDVGLRMRNSMMSSFSRIIDAGIENKADFMVISGDLYDDANVQPSVRLALCNELRRFGKPVFIARGNHDSESPWDKAIPYPDNVHEFPIIQHHYTMTIRGSQIDVTGISFCEIHDGRNLVSMISGLNDRFTVAVVHCDTYSKDGNYAPCDVSDLNGRNVDYWALGHIHKREVISEKPYAVYPGNIQGRSIKETGEKGAYLVTVEDGEVSELRFIPTQAIIWTELRVDVTGKSLDAVLDDICGKLGPENAVRIIFEGSGESDAPLRTNLNDILSVISDRSGCITAGALVETVRTVDLNSIIGRGDMCSKVIEVSRYLSENRDAIENTIFTNPVAEKNRAFYDMFSDEELNDMVENSMRSIILKMEASR